MKVNVEKLLKLKQELAEINSADLADIEFYENGKLLDISAEIISEWEFIGMNNVDFITTGFYKGEPGEEQP
jgi:hypothetical protein